MTSDVTREEFDQLRQALHKLEGQLDEVVAELHPLPGAAKDEPLTAEEIEQLRRLLRRANRDDKTMASVLRYMAELME